MGASDGRVFGGWVGGSPELTKSQHSELPVKPTDPVRIRYRVGGWVSENCEFLRGGWVGCDGNWETKCPHKAKERNPEVREVDVP